MTNEIITPIINILILMILPIFGTILIYFLKKFFVVPPPKFILDTDGILERLLIIGIVVQAPEYWGLIVPIIILRDVFYLKKHWPNEAILRKEPANEFQKSRTKMEFGLDLFISPTFAIICGLILLNLGGI